jgi:prolyl-tRNA synthetase
LQFVAVDADSGAMGGSQSQEFMVYSDAGEDWIASCPACGYAANLEKAISKPGAVEDLAATGDGKPELVSTPGKGSIADVAAFLGISPANDIKTVAYMATPRVVDKTKPGAGLQAVAVFLRGDHTVNEAKLLNLLGATEIRPMQGEELAQFFQAPAGFLGPVGLNVGVRLMSGGLSVVLDQAVQGRRNMICGANQLDYHFRNVTPGSDFQFTAAADIRNVLEGEGCPHCDGVLTLGKAVEIGHIFKLGYKYTESMGASVLDPNGKETKPIMGSYGIGMERILTTVIEQNHDGNGFWMTPSIAPFDVVVTVTNSSDAALASAGEQTAKQLEDAGFDVLLDDRNERAGVKFKDADLVGIPYRVNVGKKFAEGWVELVTRSSASSQDVEASQVAAVLQSLNR